MMRTWGGVSVAFAGDGHGKSGAYGDECQDRINDVEHAECSFLVRHGSVALHLTLEADR